MDIPLDNDIKAQLIADGYTVVNNFKAEPKLPQPPISDPTLLFPNIGPPSENIKSSAFNPLHVKGATTSNLNIDSMLPPSSSLKGSTETNNVVQVPRYVAPAPRPRTRSQPYQAPQPGKGGLSSGPSSKGVAFDNNGAPVFVSPVSKIEIS